MSIPPDRIRLLEELEGKIGYRFETINLLDTALTHDSFANEHRGEGVEGNERLEFLGDAVLGLVVSVEIFERYPGASEGSLTQMRSSLVSGATLSQVARRLGLGTYLRIGQGEEITGGRGKDSILGSALEALWGAIYQDGGADPARETILRLLASGLAELSRNGIPVDHKSRLQEITQEQFRTLPVYDIIGEEGLPHEKMFRARVSVAGTSLSAEGEGRNKQAAEQDAARELSRKLDSGEKDS